MYRQKHIHFQQQLDTPLKHIIVKKDWVELTNLNFKKIGKKRFLQNFRLYLVKTLLKDFKCESNSFMKTLNNKKLQWFEKKNVAFKGSETLDNKIKDLKSLRKKARKKL